MKGLLDAVGAHLGSMLGSTPAGVQAKDNQLLFEPDQIAHIRGHITSAAVTSKGLIIKFSDQH